LLKPTAIEAGRVRPVTMRSTHPKEPTMSKKMSKKIRKFWSESASESVLNDYRKGRVRVVLAGQVQPTKKSAPVRKRNVYPADIESVMLHGKTQTMGIVTDDLTIPKELDRTNGQSREQIDALRDKLIAKDKARSSVQHKILTQGITAPLPRSSTLTEADKKAIKEIEAQQQKDKAAKTSARINKLLEQKGMPTVTVKTIKTAKPAKKLIRSSAKSDQKANAVFDLIKRKDGASNAEMNAQKCRRTVGALKQLCKARGYKLDVKNVKGESKRYIASKN
jgi:hypothetical protein